MNDLDRILQLSGVLSESKQKQQEIRWVPTKVIKNPTAALDANRLLMLRVADEQPLPSEVKAPIACARRATAEIESGQLKSFDTIDDLMTYLHADD